MYTYTSPCCPIRQSDAGFPGGGFPETTIMLAVLYQVHKRFGITTYYHLCLFIILEIHLLPEITKV